jgi:hypothetical protein
VFNGTSDLHGVIFLWQMVGKKRGEAEKISTDVMFPYHDSNKKKPEYIHIQAYSLLII